MLPVTIKGLQQDANGENRSPLFCRSNAGVRLCFYTCSANPWYRFIKSVEWTIALTAIWPIHTRFRVCSWRRATTS